MLCRTLDSAVRQAHADAAEGRAAGRDSSAVARRAASFDQFPNFEDRGEQLPHLRRAI
ncbi:MAG: hypothetical protein ACMVO3_22115 [Thalassobaculum sp.]